MTRPETVAWTIHQAKEAGVDSLLEMTEEQWLAFVGTKGGHRHGFLFFARDAIENLNEGPAGTRSIRVMSGACTDCRG